MARLKISGGRLNTARDIRSLKLKDLAVDFNVAVDTILDWQENGIPPKKVKTVANHFMVEEWVFSDEDLPDWAFVDIIGDPSLQARYSPLSRSKNGSPQFILKHLQKNRNEETKSFYLTQGTTILVRSKVWGTTGQAITQLSLRHENENLKDCCSAIRMHVPPPQANILRSAETPPEEITTQDNIFNIVENGHYRLLITAPGKCEIMVYELLQHPNV